MQGSVQRETKYGFIDVSKFVLALLIIVSHYISENAVSRIHTVVDFASSLYVIVVPFFFACSGFLLFRKVYGNEQDRFTVKTYCKKILIMYAGWSMVYFLFTLLKWFRFGTTTEDVLHYFLNAVTYSTYKTIWFLPATVIGVLMTYFLVQFVGEKKAAIAGVILYLLGCLGASYSFLLPNNKVLTVYNYIFSSSRNGVFNGFPFVLVGYFIARKENNGFVITRTKNLISAAIFGMGFLMEALVIKRWGAPNVNTLIFLLPFTYFFVMWCLGIRMKVSGRTIWLRRMSTEAFLCQRLFLSALPGLFPESIFGKLLTGNPYVGLISITMLTLITSAALIQLSGRNKWLAQFC